MSKAHLIPGFNVFDGGKGTIGQLEYCLTGTGYMPVLHNVGHIGLIELRCENRKAVRRLKGEVKSDDIIFAHSNGCLIAWHLVHQGYKPKAIVTINPALRRDTVWPSDVRIVNLYSCYDWVVQLGRVWSRLVSLGTFSTHGWGAAGRYGFTAPHKNMEQFDMGLDYWTFPVRSHSGVFKEPYALQYWTGRAMYEVDK